jgi:hypothetical protein
MKSLIKFFDCGNISKANNVYRYRVSKFLDLTNKVIPLLKKYPILGEKSKDFEDFCKVVEIMKLKRHLTKEGLEEIRAIKVGMNTGR